jgi:photosystem II stability/assembly factor-like uncharacterized protein
MFVQIVQTPDAPSIFRSEDSGATWTPVSSERLIARIVFDPSDPGYVFLDNMQAVIRSADSGQTFERVSATLNSPSGLLRTGAWNLAVDPTSPATLYGSSVFGLARSDDHGSTWRNLYSGCGFCPATPLFVDPRTPSTLYAAASSAGFGSGLVKSIDGGASWRLTSDQAQFDSASLRRSQSNPDVFFANIQGRVMRSADAGVTWTPVNGLRERMLPLALEVAPSEDAVVYMTYQRGSDLFVTKFDANAGGVLFTAVAGGFGSETVARIRVDAGGRIYVAGSTDSLDFPADSLVADGDLFDAFAIAFDPGIGSTNPVYSRRIGGVGRTTAGDMAVDCAGNVVLAATSNSPDLSTATGGYDVVLAQFSPDGAVTSLSNFGGEKDDAAAAVAVDPEGRIHLAGFTASPTLPSLPQRPAEQTLFTSVFEASLARCK